LKIETRESGPVARDESEHTARRLLDSAEELFADRGYDATSIRQIVNQCGRNTAAVNYHFGSKENLYLEVVRRQLGDFRDSLLQRTLASAPVATGVAELEAVIASYAHAFIEPLAQSSKNRLLLRVLSRELNDPHLPSDLLFVELVEPVGLDLARAVAAACPSAPSQGIMFSVQLLTGQLIHLIRMHDYFGLDRCSRLAFPLSAASVDMIVRFTVGGIRAMVCIPEAGSETPAKQRRDR